MTGEQHLLLMRQTCMPCNCGQSARVLLPVKYSTDNFGHCIFGHDEYIVALSYVKLPGPCLLHPVRACFLVQGFRAASQLKCSLRLGFNLVVPTHKVHDGFKTILRGDFLLTNRLQIMLQRTGLFVQQPV